MKKALNKVVFLSLFIFSIPAMGNEQNQNPSPTLRSATATGTFFNVNDPVDIHAQESKCEKYCERSYAQCIDSNFFSGPSCLKQKEYCFGDCSDEIATPGEITIH
jgi:hypothetical protein